MWIAESPEKFNLKNYGIFDNTNRDNTLFKYCIIFFYKQATYFYFNISYCFTYTYKIEKEYVFKLCPLH